MKKQVELNDGARQFPTGLSVSEQNCLDQCLKMEAECRSLWIRALEFSPRLAHYCKHWHDFTPEDWGVLLAGNPDLITIAPLHELSMEAWYIILSRQPSLVEKCCRLDEFNDKLWNSLLEYYPWFEQYRKKR